MSLRVHAWAEDGKSAGVIAPDVLLSRCNVSFAVVVGPSEDAAAPAGAGRAVHGGIGATECFTAEWTGWRGELAAVAVLSAFSARPPATLSPFASAAGFTALEGTSATLMVVGTGRRRRQVGRRQKIRKRRIGRLAEILRMWMCEVVTWSREVLLRTGHVGGGLLREVWDCAPIHDLPRHVSHESARGRNIVTADDHEGEQDRDFHDRNHCMSDPDCNNSQRPAPYRFCPHVEGHGGERRLFAVFRQILVGGTCASHK